MDKKITIGLFIDTFFPMVDGVVNVVDNYAKRLIKYANVIVFAPEVPGSYFDDSKLNYNVVRCKSIIMPAGDYCLPVPDTDVKFKKILNNSNLDIVHIHSPFTLGKVGINYAKRHNIPVIGTMHSQFKQDFKRAVKSEHFAELLNKVPIHEFNSCDECWAVNNEVARIFYEEYKCKNKPIVMNNATGMLPLVDVLEAKNTIKNMYKISNDEKVLLFVGRINKLKNIFFILESLRILKEKYSNFKFKMLFVGSGQDEGEFKEKIEKYNMQDYVIMTGRVTDRKLLAKYYSCADLFLFPSMYDASSIVQIEAASQHTPSLFLKGSATSATITENVNGYLSENDPEAYAKKIVEIFLDMNSYKTVCDNAFSQIYKNWDDVIKDVYERYLKLIEIKKRSANNEEK